MLQCYAVSSKQTVATVTVAVPAGCSSIKSLHALDGSHASNADSCLLLAVCSSSSGRGSTACAWCCEAIGDGVSSSSTMQLQLTGTAAIPGSAAVTAAAAAGSTQQLLLGTADGMVLLLSVSTGAAGVQLQQAACLQEEGPVAAVAADEHCLHVASASQAGISVWTAAADSTSEADPSWHYSRAMHVPLPTGAGAATGIAWLRHTVVPCLAVATSSNSLLLLSTCRDGGSSSSSSSWQWAAHLPAAVGGGASGAMHLASGSGCSSVVAAAGNQLLRLSEVVALPGSDAQPEGSTELLGRQVLHQQLALVHVLVAIVRTREQLAVLPAQHRS